jgi:hypothetical protein
VSEDRGIQVQPDAHQEEGHQQFGDAMRHIVQPPPRALRQSHARQKRAHDGRNARVDGG